jgi:hypothetical protein
VPDGGVGWPTVAAGLGDELFLVARSERGSLYLSRAKSAEASNPSGWSTPSRIQTRHDGKVSPAEIGWDDAGNLFLAYSVQANDERGVYLIQSSDLGETWSDPYLVFNGVAAGFELVGPPYLYVSSNGRIAILWKQQSIQAEDVPQTISLYFAYSADAGRTFSEAKRVVEGPVGWRTLGIDGQGNLHLFWQSLDDMNSLWNQVSYDGGQSWQSPVKFPVDEGLVTVTADPGGRLHLVESGLSGLHHWLWDGNHWQEEALTNWSPASLDATKVTGLAASVNENGKMAVVMAASNSTSDAKEALLYFAARSIDLQPIEIKSQETPVQVVTTAEVTPPEPTPTVELTLAGLQTPNDLTTSSDLSTVSKVMIPVALLLIGVFGVVTVKAVRGRNR